MSHVNPSTAFTFGNLWPAAIPFVPLVALSAALSRLVDPGERLGFLALGPEAYVAAPARNFIHLGDILNYYALAAVHVGVCLVAIGWFLGRMRNLPASQRTPAFVFLGSGLALLLPVILTFAVIANDSVLVQLGFKATCMALEAADLPTRLAAEGCFAGGLTGKLTLLAWIPTFAGMGAVLTAAAFAHGTAQSLPPRAEPEWKAAVACRVETLEHSVYALSAVLVSSTITITLFARLPLGLLVDGSDIAAAMSAYTAGLSTFWGGLFTLTLVSTFVIPFWRLLRHTRAYGPEGMEEPDIATWFREHVLASARRRAASIASLLAPLLVGPLGSLLVSLTGG